MKKKTIVTKRIVTGLLLAGMVASLAACGKKDAGAGGGQTQGTTDSTSQENNGSEETTEGASEDGAASGEVSEGAGASVDDSVTIDEVYNAVKEAYGENYLPNVMLTDDEIAANYSINGDWYTEAIAEIPMINVQIDTFIAIKATDDHIADVTAAITAYQDNLKADTMQYPSNLNKIQASTVVTMDNYVFFIMLGNITSEQEEADETTQIEAYTELNQIAVDAIEGVLLK